MKRQTPIYEHNRGDMCGKLFSVMWGNDRTYYYKIYYLIDGKHKLIAQSYVNCYDKELCLNRMLHDMEIIDESKAKRLK